MRNPLGGVDGNREADAGRCAGRRVDRRIDANHFAMRVDQGAAGIAAIDGSIRLYRFIDQRVLPGLNGTAKRADDPGGQRALKSKWISDRKDFLPDLERGGIPERQYRQRLFARFDLHQRHVVALIGTNKLCRMPRLVAQHHLNRLCALHDVKIRQDVALRVNHEAGACALDRNRVHPEIVFSRLCQNIGDGGRRLPVDANVQRFIATKGSIAFRKAGIFDRRRIRGARNRLDINWLPCTPPRTSPIGT